jgi:TatD DNase family protein
MNNEKANLIDIHAHLESIQFKEDLDQVIKNAEKAGIKIIINSGTNPKRNRETLELANKYDLIKASFGFYPIGNFSKDIDEEIKWIEEHKEDCLAIGEIGLDFQEDRKENFGRQEELFKKMLELAVKINKPVIIHSRGAEKEAIEILEKYYKKLKIIMHCFCGKKSLIKKSIELGFFFSIPPVIKRWENFIELVKLVPLEKLLTETDSPYLSPIQGQRNEPANVAVTIKEIAKIKQINEQKIAETIFNNAQNLFNL